MSSKTDVAVKLSLVFFIALLSFSIGTFVGKKYSDNQHQLAALEPSKATHTQERAVASVNTHGAPEEKSGAMTDDEIAKLAEEFVADDATPVAAHGEEHGSAHAAPAAHGEAAHGGGHDAHGAVATETKTETKEVPRPAPGVKGDKVTHNEEPSTAAKNVASGKAPAAAVTTEKAPAKTTTAEGRLPSSLPKDVAQYTAGKFTVQVASYADEAEAQKYASDLKNKGYSAFYIPANIKGKTWFRVSVGQFTTQKEAQSYRSELVNKAQVGSAIVQKITE